MPEERPSLTQTALNDNDDDSDAADLWFARMNSGDPVSPDLEAAFDAWIQADPDHARAYRDCQMAWMELGLGSCAPPVLAMRARALRTAAGPSRRRLLFGLGGAAVATGIGGAVWLGAAPSPARALIVTTSGQRLTAPLPDGSRVTLAPLSRVRLDFDDRRRGLRLEAGQAFFEVAHDAARPFVVEAGDRRVTATGTRFQVTLAGGRTDAEVVLEQGEVIVASRDAAFGVPRRLAPGQRLSAAKRARVEPVDVETATAWRVGRLVVRNRPLSEVVADFNRYSGDRLILGSPDLGPIRISGSFRYDGAREFALALEGSFGLRVKGVEPGVWRIDFPDGVTTVP
ncbi:hypothetical protein BZG35_09810 [Brevundimonas sp. LM2]|uniref:FecR family protein n=1 Tax=Brevundimonas sp. LM2 TaxID=1938605 RepID=UPI000983B2D5|nr:FecR domain-containing protein [Brevundimonas sp. LM2]AQR61911.1 hypothetical protein BZG35_09810 [Brevundimonas sp. LM2]